MSNQKIKTMNASLFNQIKSAITDATSINGENRNIVVGNKSRTKLVVIYPDILTICVSADIHDDHAILFNCENCAGIYEEALANAIPNYSFICC